MIIKAGKSLSKGLDLGMLPGAKSPLIVLPGQSIELDDALAKEPIIQKSVARGDIVIMNFCGFVLGEGVGKITVGTTPPTAPRTGDLWIDIS